MSRSSELQRLSAQIKTPILAGLERASYILTRQMWDYLKRRSGSEDNFVTSGRSGESLERE